ncbi:hypothetical protein O0L34_g10819 [Tuta absoluta]|nr:hypothetical protein O0L34_g10819 [Tuta absoluta]
MIADGGVWSLRNLTISVPRAALSGEGQAAVLRCCYELEGAQLYSIRWYRAETEFYRYVPREMPPTMVFPLPGATVDLTQSDHQQVRIVNLNRRLSGLYQCEVSADAPLFHTDIASAPLTVVDPPFRAPRLYVSRGSYSRGDVIRANCTVDEAYPAPNITWMLDKQKIAESVAWPPSDLDFKERASHSSLELTVLETDQYKLGLSYSSVGLSVNVPSNLPGNYYNNHRVENYRGNSEEREIIRYAMAPSPAGYFSLSCQATIFSAEIYERNSEPVTIREDAPHPASVTGDDSKGASVTGNVLVTLCCAWAALRYVL